MRILQGIAFFIAEYLLNEPAILMGLVAFIGLVVQKKSFNQTITGTIKTIAGFLIIGVGAGIIVKTILPIASILEYVAGIEVASVGMGTDKFIELHGGTITLIMALGFLINIILARLTRFKYIYLTGHQMFWMVFVYVALTIEVIPTVSRTTMIIVGSLLAGLYFTLSPALVQPFLRKVTGSDDFAFGHTTSFGVIMGSVLGGFVGNPEQSTEDINLPESLEFLKDVTVSTTIITVLMYLIGVLLAGKGYIEVNVSGGQDAFTYAILQGLNFGVGLTVSLMGVGMMVAEIIPAFRGISMKVVPNAIQALDAPVVFNYAPTAVMIGFLSSLVTTILCMIIFGSIGWFILTPPVITCFFGGGPAGVFGNSTGGWKGAIAAGVAAGLMISFGQALSVPLLSSTVADFARRSADFDYSILAPIYYHIIKLFAH